MLFTLLLCANLLAGGENGGLSAGGAALLAAPPAPVASASAHMNPAPSVAGSAEEAEAREERRTRPCTHALLASACVPPAASALHGQWTPPDPVKSSPAGILRL